MKPYLSQKEVSYSNNLLDWSLFELDFFNVYVHAHCPCMCVHIYLGNCANVERSEAMSGDFLGASLTHH